MFNSAYSEKQRVQLTCTDPTRTKQSFKAECDINTIIARFLRTGVMDFAQKHEPRYGDCTGQEFQSAMNTVSRAQSLFLDLPAALRGRFENDPAKFLDFIQDTKNRDEAIELGLIAKPKPAPSSDPVRESTQPVQEKPAA